MLLTWILCHPLKFLTNLIVYFYRIYCYFKSIKFSFQKKKKKLKVRLTKCCGIWLILKVKGQANAERSVVRGAECCEGSGVHQAKRRIFL